MIDFDKNKCNSIKSIAVRGNTTIDVTARLMKGKMLMFAKMSLKSFVYDLTNVFCFLMEEVRKLYNQHDIIKCHINLNLTDTNSFSMLFNFISKKEFNIKDSDLRKLIFKILKHSKIAEGLNVSNKFREQLKMLNEKVKKHGAVQCKRLYNCCKGYFEKF